MREDAVRAVDDELVERLALELALDAEVLVPLLLHVRGRDLVTGVRVEAEGQDRDLADVAVAELGERGGQLGLGGRDVVLQADVGLVTRHAGRDRATGDDTLAAVDGGHHGVLVDRHRERATEVLVRRRALAGVEAPVVEDEDRLGHDERTELRVGLDPRHVRRAGRQHVELTRLEGGLVRRGIATDGEVDLLEGRLLAVPVRVRHERRSRTGGSRTSS